MRGNIKDLLICIYKIVGSKQRRSSHWLPYYRSNVRKFREVRRILCVYKVAGRGGEPYARPQVCSRTYGKEQRNQDREKIERARQEMSIRKFDGNF